MCVKTTADAKKIGYRFFSLSPDGSIHEGIATIIHNEQFRIRSKGRKAAKTVIKTKNIAEEQLVRTKDGCYLTQGSLCEHNNDNVLEIGYAPSYFINKVVLHLPAELGKKCIINDNTGRLPIIAKTLIVLRQNTSLTVKIRGAFYTVSYSGKKIISAQIEN